MRIVVNDIAASYGGAMTILKGFYEYVCNNDKENEWIFLLSDKYFEETDNVKIIVRQDIKNSGIKKFVFDLFAGKRFINSFNPDVVFSLQNIITFGVKAPQCTYIHQSLPYTKMKSFSFFKSSERVSAVYQKLIGQLIHLSAKKANKVIVQSKWMKDAVIEKTGISNSKIVNIMPDVEDLSQFKRDNVFDKRVFFYPTADNIYKNNDCIIEACRILEKEGFTDFRVILTVSEGELKDLPENIECRGRLSREELLDQYNRTTLLFPSYVETVGLPMLEARLMNSIVLASNCPFSTEVLEKYDNAYYFDPFKPQELAELMKKVISGEINRNQVEGINQGHSISSWQRIKDEVLEVASI